MKKKIHKNSGPSGTVLQELEKSSLGLKKFAEIGDTVTLKARGQDWKTHPWQVNIIITNARFIY